MDILKLQKKSIEVRKNIIEMLYLAGSGHSGGALGMADVMTYLYFNEMKINPKNPKLKSRDFFFLSNGHTCPVLYSCLALRGFFDLRELDRLRKINSLLQGHPHNTTIPGVENSGGPLGQGISQAVGLASVLKRENKKNKVYCYVGDGELEEGECYEAIMYASKEKLDNFILIVDLNHIQIDGDPKEVGGIDNLHNRFNSLGFRVVEFNGNNMSQIKHVFESIKFFKNKPLCLLAKSIPGKGVSFMEGDYTWHGKAPNKEERNLALSELESELILLEDNKK